MFQGIPGPEDTESAWRGGVRKDGEGGRVRGFQGKWTESRGFQFGGVERWIGEKQIKGEKIETTGNTQKGNRPMEELGWVGRRAWGRKQCNWLETWMWAQLREGLEASEQQTRSMDSGTE